MLHTLFIHYIQQYYGFLQRIFVKATSGRQRFNVLGALNTITHKLVTITTEVSDFLKCIYQ